MATIMCASKLWRVVRGWDLAPAADELGTLGPWAATRFQEEELDLVIAISVSTFLTLVIPLDEATAMGAAFRAALAGALEDLGVPTSRVETEVASASYISLCRLREPRLRAVLEDIEAFCGLELCYHSDLRVVQRNLNELPHGDLDVHVPSAAVAAWLRKVDRRGRLN